MTLALLLFWGSIALVLFVYIGFPLLVFVKGALFPVRHRTAPITPPVSMIVAAYNEAGTIAEKIRNIAELDYPADQFEAIIASDGSDDGTPDIVRAGAAGRIRLLDLPRQGKAGALNAAVAVAGGEILVMSDANSLYAPDALRQLVRHFADERVGGVAGNQRYAKDKANKANAGETTYWGFDRQLKVWESRAGNAISATGAIYAIRRSLFQGVPIGVTDDFAVSTSVIAQGYRLVFEPDAVAYELAAGSQKREFGRKVRIMTRGLAGVMLRSELLNPLRHGFYSLQLFTHKLLRRLLFIPLVIIFASNLALATSGWLYALAMIAQVVFYGVALTGALLISRGRQPSRPVAMVTYACMVYAAAAVAAWNIVRGRRIVSWTTDQRAS